MKKKRFFMQIFKLLLILISTLLVFALGYNIFYNSLSQDEVTIRENYEAKKEKCELLRTIAKDFIKEGQGIDIQAITGQDIEYRIYNRGEDIIFYYSIEENNSESNYYATITLSANYNILKEEYSDEIETFEEYEQNTKTFEKVISAFVTFLFVILIYLLCILAYFMMQMYKEIKSRQKHE